MRPVRYLRRAASVVVALASTMLGFLLFAPSASALVMPPPGMSPTGPSPRPAQTLVHSAVTGGFAGWEIALIAIGAAVVAATFAVYTDRARESHRKVRVSAA